MQTGLADSVRATWVYIACVPAGTLDTLVRVPTVPVYCTGGHWGDWGQRVRHFSTRVSATFGSTLPTGSNERVIRTDADDRPDWRTGLHLTGLRPVAGPVDQTRVLALCIYTGQRRGEQGTVIVNLTLRDSRFRCYNRTWVTKLC